MGLLQLHSIILPLRIFFILQKFLLCSLCHFYIWQVSPQLGCNYTCQIWAWYSVGNRCFDNDENRTNNGREEIVLVVPTLNQCWCTISLYIVKMKGTFAAKYYMCHEKLHVSLIKRIRMKLQMMTSERGNDFRISGPLRGVPLTKSQWFCALMFSLPLAWTSCWQNSRVFGVLKHCHVHVTSL